MSTNLDNLCWPVSRLAEATEALARSCGLAPATLSLPTASAAPERQNSEDAGQTIEATATGLGLEAEIVETPYAEIESLIRSSAPALLRLGGEEGPGFIAVVKTRKRTLFVLGPDLTVARLQPERLRAALCHELEEPLYEEVEQLLNDVGVPRGRQEQARVAILRERLRGERIGECWLLRLSPGVNFWQQLRQQRLPHRLFALVAAHTIEYCLWILSWWLVGQGALQGRLDRGWLLAWLLLLLTLVPFRLLVTWLEGTLAIGAGGLLKQRLLYGVLRLEPEEIRHQGVGQFLGRIIESEAVESLALTGGLLGLVALIELAMAAGILVLGSGGGLHVLMLLLWIVFALWLGWHYFRHRERWTSSRLSMTHDLIEGMVGHRTRLAQEAREGWHDGEDQALKHHLDLSQTMDRTAARLISLVPRGWLGLGIVGLAPAFVAGGSTPAGLAIAIGGILLAYRAFKRLAAGLWHIAGAAIGWQQVSQLFYAAGRPEQRVSPAVGLADPSNAKQTDQQQPVMEAHEIVFRYRKEREPVLRGCNLEIMAGDRLLLEGSSGGGKSTLVAILTGLRLPQSGLLMLQGLDHQTLGSKGWRKRVVAAPQFHENHVLTGTFAFNLLMGRRWPPKPEDIEEAEALCQELGLGELLDRMPDGLLQMVGETGWQLSHGERSRLYIARALLQGADLIILDESFAALDPVNLSRALGCVMDRASTLLVIAHP